MIVIDSDDEFPAAQDDLDALDALAGLGALPGDGGAAAGLGEADLDKLEDIGREGGALEEQAADASLPVEDLDRLQQLANRNPPRPPRKFAKRSRELMAFARQKLATTRAAVRAQRAQAEKEDLANQLQMVKLNFSGVARACGLYGPKGKRPPGTSQKCSEAKAALLVRAAFQKSAPNNIGIRFERLTCFAAKLYLELQTRGLISLMMSCAWFRAQADEASSRYVFMTYTYESDSTQQSMSQEAIQRVGRPTKQRLSTEVLNQRGYITVELAIVDRNTGERHSAMLAESLVSESVVLLGKTAPFLHKGMQRGLAFDFDGEAQGGWARLIELACDLFVFHQYGDKGSNNMPAFRHFAATASAMPSVLADISCCEIHVVQGMKNAVPDTKQYVGRMYGLGNICKTASIHYGLVSILEYTCHTAICRVIAPPPAAYAEDLRLLFDCLYDFEAAYHKRGRPREQTNGEQQEVTSVLLEDLAALLASQTFPHSSDDRLRVHYCWDPATKGPCCESEDEAREKATVAQVNFHASRAIERVTISRWTHMAKTRKRLIVGMTCQKLFLTSFCVAASKSVPEDVIEMQAPIPAIDIRAEEVGAGDTDRQLTHQTRCARVCQWIQSKPFWYVLPIAEVCESLLDALQYKFFGKSGEVATVEEICDRHSSPIATCMGSLWDLLCDWRAERDSPWKVLFLAGWDEFDDQEVRLCARRHCLNIAANVALRFEIKYSELPWTLHRLVSPSWSTAEQRAICEHLQLAKDCDVPLFAQQFRDMFPSIDEMLSPKAAGALRAHARSTIFSTKASELGHASERQALAAAAAPGKTCVHHFRRDVLNKARNIHINNGGADPLDPFVSTSGQKRRRQESSVGEVTWNMLRPLEPLVPLETQERLQASCTNLDESTADLLQKAVQLPLAIVGGQAPRAIMGSPLAALAQVAPPPPPEPAEVRPLRSGAGGSVFTNYANHCKRSAKLAAGGRTLTEGELRDIQVRARAEWAQLSEDAKHAYRIQYERDVRRRRLSLPPRGGEALAPVQKQYKGALNIGNATEVISAKMFCQAGRRVEQGAPRNFSPTQTF